MHGLVAKPIRNDPSIELVAKRGLEHEARYLDDLLAEGRRVVEIEKDGSAVAPPGAHRRDGTSSGTPARSCGRRRPDARRHARRRRRRLPGDVLRRDLARPRGLPAPPGSRAGRAGQRVRPVALRGGGHQARPPREGVGHPPDLLLRGAADRDPGQAAGVPVRRAGRQRATDGPPPRGRLHGLLPPCEAGVRDRGGRARRWRSARDVPARRHVPGARGALRRVPLGAAVHGPAPRGRRPEPGRGRRRPPAERAQGQGGRDASRPGRAGAADGAAARERGQGGAGPRPGAGADPGRVAGRRQRPLGAAPAGARRGRRAGPAARLPRLARAQRWRPVPGSRG